MYRFNQYRRFGQTFSTPLQYTITTLETQSASDTGIIFADKKILVPLAPTEENGIKKKNYFFRLKIVCKANPQSITIRLFNSQQMDLEKAYQNIENIKVPGSSISGDFRTYDIIIPPNNNYDQIHITLDRNMDDYVIDFKEDGEHQGRAINMSVLRLEELQNMIFSCLGNDVSKEGRLKQIGVQGPTGLQMCIDGEQIKLGRSGLFEINNGIAVSFISFIVTENDDKHFILDYQY